MKKFLKEFSWFFGLGLLIGVLLIGGFKITQEVVRESVRPEILILSETFVTNWEGQTILLVDYTVGGIATNAMFRDHQMEKYNALMDHLERTGRVKR